MGIKEKTSNSSKSRKEGLTAVKGKTKNRKGAFTAVEKMSSLKNRNTAVEKTSSLKNRKEELTAVTFILKISTLKRLRNESKRMIVKVSKVNYFLLKKK